MDAVGLRELGDGVDPLDQAGVVGACACCGAGLDAHGVRSLLDGFSESARTGTRPPARALRRGSRTAVVSHFGAKSSSGGDLALHLGHAHAAGGRRRRARLEQDPIERCPVIDPRSKITDPPLDHPARLDHRARRHGHRPRQVRARMAGAVDARKRRGRAAGRRRCVRGGAVSPPAHGLPAGDEAAWPVSPSERLRSAERWMSPAGTHDPG